MKKNNKGFSLVELIIVIAIMAILAGALAPALIKYINKSRRSTDISNADTIRSAIQTAMSNEGAADEFLVAKGDVEMTFSDGSVSVESGLSDYDTIVSEVESTLGSTKLSCKYYKGTQVDDYGFKAVVNYGDNTVVVYGSEGTELSPNTPSD